jgi:ppGpp synthetase/RelA/SpoT-type nucleotidyltranferase
LAEAERTVEDRLREEYFTLLPEIRRVADRLEAEIRYHALPISGALHGYERLVVKCRVKSCESALNKLRRRQQGRIFQRNEPDLYSLTSLNDLAGVRVLAFPRNRLAEVDSHGY